MTSYFSSNLCFGRTENNLMLSRTSALKIFDHKDGLGLATVKQFNDVVKNTSDILYIVGNLVGRPTSKRDIEDIDNYLNKINGIKILIPSERDVRFLSSSLYRNSGIKFRINIENMVTSVSSNGNKFVLSHYPLRNWETKPRGSYNVYGQSLYSSLINGYDNEFSISVSLDSNSLKPLSGSDIIGILNTYEVPF